MKPLLLAFFASMMFSCREDDKKIIPSDPTKNWSADSIRHYFRDSISPWTYNGRYSEGIGLTNFDTFSKYVLADIKAKNIDDPFILGFDENYVDTTKIDHNKKWLRISVAPCFRIPYCLILEQRDNRSVLILKMTNGQGCNSSGYLSFLSTQALDSSLYSSIAKRLRELNFWQLGKDTSCGRGLDGERWTFEAIENGQYHILTRWVPQHCGNEITRQLARIGIDLMKKCHFIDYLMVITGESKKELQEWYFDG